MPIENVTLEGFLAGILASIIAGIILEGWRRRLEEQDEVKRWYQDTLGYLARLQRLGYRATEFQTLNHDILRTEVDPLADDIQDHAGSAPEGVPDKHRYNLKFHAGLCSHLITASEGMDDSDRLQLLNLVQQSGEDRFGDNYDIDQVNEFLDGVNYEGLIHQLEKEGEGVEPDEEAFEEFVDSIGGEPGFDSVNQVLEMDVDKLEQSVPDDSFLETVMESSMRELARIVLIDKTEEQFKAMEEYKQSM